MKHGLLSTIQRTAKYWWVGLLIGILILILGFWSFTVPVATLLSLNILFIVGFIVSGIGDISYAIAVRKESSDWGWILAGGIISLILGLALASRPLESVVILLLYVGFWVAFQAVMTIATSISMQRNGWKGWGWFLFLGILGVIFSILLITNPAYASGFIVALFSISLILYGVTRIYYSFKLRKLNQMFKSEEDMI